MRVLLHVCCAPCSIHPLSRLRADGHQVSGYFYNPNIHPYTEHKKRLTALREYAAAEDWPLIGAGDYALEEFLRATVYREKDRCRFCYGMRLEAAARVARHGRFDAFSTTLLASPYQKHDLVRETGIAAGEAAGIPFLYLDFRPGYREGYARARELGLYRQAYCGCIYSEKERYHKEPRKSQ
ncbi:MAG: epoxyqueuosine reductase QueH [Peptococcaceae bacterium]|jgi:predicted adenine nucleotide alpha hydrolase (AANH) superfamily ATPase|nr:epoxyqueuosine reductase QueH [Peptococcaceae bacterium]